MFLSSTTWALGSHSDLVAKALVHETSFQLGVCFFFPVSLVYKPKYVLKNFLLKLFRKNNKKTKINFYIMNRRVSTILFS